MVVSRTAELIRKAESNPTTWHRYEEKLKDDSFGSVQAYKTAVTSGDRLVYVVEQSQIILVDIINCGNFLQIILRLYRYFYLPN
jgi:Txe/YoeB family toxin of Txe-Axe toxin-antitoxin module